MSGQGRRLLVVCHIAAADAGAAAARTTYGIDAEIHVFGYGRASEETPGPPGARLIQAPVQDGLSWRKALELVLTLRHQRYDNTALCQPALAQSRARALLLAFSRFVGRRRATILDPLSGRVVGPITIKLVIADSVRWLTLQGVSHVCAKAASSILRRFRSGPAVPDVAPGATGSVLYLRTDLDLVTAPLRAGGSLAHTEGVLKALTRRGNQVTLLATGEIDGIPADVREGRLPGLVVGNLPTEVAELLSGLWQVLRVSRRHRPSGFIYQRYSLNNLAGVLLSARWRVPLILEANGSEAKWRQDFSALHFPRLAYACEQFILSRSNRISVVSDNAARDLLNSGAPPDRLRTVPNGVDVERFAGVDPVNLSELDGAFTVCFSGLFYPWHGVRFLAEAFAQLHRERPDARLLLVGEGEEAPAVRAVLARHGALEATHFAGLIPRTEVPRYLAAADVLVSPHANVRDFIGSPIKLFEYMAAGRAIVATRVGQIPDMLRDGETALLVPPEDPQAMAVALARLQDDDDLRARLGATARREAQLGHSWEARVASLLD